MVAGRNEKGQFVKGASGNPEGRKPRETEQYFLDLFRSSVSDADFKAVVEALVKAAKRGNTSAIKIILDYLMGVPKQKQDISLEHKAFVEIRGVDYRTVAAKLAPGPVQDSDPSGEGENFIDGPPVG